MTPEFAQAVDPVYLRVLGLLERIDRDESFSQNQAEDERAAIRGYLDQAEGRLGQREDWGLAKYALVSWIDEVLIEAPWKHRGWWKQNTLEWEKFKTSECSEQFYLKQKEASALSRRDALEVFYVCSVLGFRGLYRDPVVAPALAEPLGLPADLETWARQTAMGIHLGQGRPRIDSTTEEIDGAPPREGLFLLIWSAFLGLILAIATAGIFVVWNFMGTAS